MCWMLRSSHSAAHTAKVNCEPLSEVMAAGTLKRAIQLWKRACAQSAVDVVASETTSAHHVVRSMMVKMVKRYVQPSEADGGPTRSTCTGLKRRPGTGMLSGFTCTCLVLGLKGSLEICVAECSKRLPNQLKSFSQKDCQAEKSYSNLLWICRQWQMAAKSQPLAAGLREPTGGYLVSLGGVGAGVLALLPFACPVFVVPAPLLPPVVPPAGGLSPATTALAAAAVRLVAAAVVVVAARQW